MKVIERFLKSKTSKEVECEDNIFISDDFAAIIDGATSKSSRKYNGKSSGKMISELLYNALYTLPRKFSVQEAVDFLSNTVFKIYQKYGIIDELKNNPVERASASVIIFSKFKNEVWMIGDCQCIIDGKHYSNHRYIDKLLSDIRSFFLHAEFKLNENFNFTSDIDLGRQFILPLLEKQSLFENSLYKNEFTFGVINGFDVPKGEIKVIKVLKSNNIILASDGYPKLYSTLKASEKYLLKILDEDPLCYKKFKSTKGLSKGNSSFDDRAYLKIRVT